MRIKSRYFREKVFPRLQEDIEAALDGNAEFRNELFDKLYDFFHRYFSESGSIYFRHTRYPQSVYEQIYTNDKDVMLFWKTRMLYYVKTDRLFKSLEVELDADSSPALRRGLGQGSGLRFFFDVSTLQHKQANEKRHLVYRFARVRAAGAVVFQVEYSSHGSKTKMLDILRALRDEGLEVGEDVLQRAFRIFEKQSEVDYFINKDAEKFLKEQFDLWMYRYLFEGQNIWLQRRLKQLQALKGLAYKIINFIAQFEDELVRVWNKPKFVRDSHYVITLDRIAGRDAELLARLLAHAGMTAQVAEWRALGMVSADFKPADVWARDLFGQRLDDRFQYLPLDTRHVPDLELAIVGLFDHLDAALDGWLIKSENYQALNTLQPRFRERVKCIYIDPPYNASESEILYQNQYKDSSWLSLIENRVRLSEAYLSDDGIFCITIDDYEVHQLRFWLDSFFSPDNYLATVVIRNNPSGRSTVKGFAVNHEYALFYSHNESSVDIGRLSHSETQIERYDEFDEEGRRFEWENLRKSSRGSNREDRPKQFFPIYSDTITGQMRVPPLEWQEDLNAWRIAEEPGENEVLIYPIDQFGTEKVWSFGLDRIIEELDQMLIKERNGRYEIYKRKYLQEEGVLPRTWWDDSAYSARDTGTRMLKDLVGPISAFDFPKSVYAVEDCLRVSHLGSSDVCLDFFAGSGTTAHAVMNLNREDGGRRKYILVEMADYFDTVLLPRVKKVAFSAAWKDGVAQEGGQGMSHFVKYYKLEQYEDVLRNARYGAEGPPFNNPYEDVYQQYVFLRDLKMLHALEIAHEENKVHVALSRLYADIDLAETLANLRGKWIARITPEFVEFEDGERIDLLDLDWEFIKPLVWW
ncbi:MAG TPA: site-specific DNA-methyltransferase [Thermoflexia bacterium]|nr:site-specific DNA-methyltransferase [Thermoflexia bacterium]